MLLGANTVHAQTGGGVQGADTGTVKDITVTPSVLQVTNPINTAATLTASTTKGTEVYNPGWRYESGPTYQWFVASNISPVPLTSPTTGTHTTVSIPAFTAAGTLSVTVTCHVTYNCVNEDGLKGTIFGNGSTTVPIYVIGGPITGDTDEYFFCSDKVPGTSVDALGYLSAAPGQPAGTTYSWSISGSAIYCDDDANAKTPTGAAAEYRGTLPGSTDIGDVKANVTYSLNGVSAKSSPDFPITIHVPKTFTITSFTPAVKFAYGFSGQTITFKVIDSVKQPYPPGKAYWCESWTGGQPPNGGGGPLDRDSQSVDSFSSDSGSSAPSDPNDAYGDRILGPLTHVYSVTHMGGTGGLIGCSIQTYTNVYYYTYQMTGNGFAQKPPTP